MNAFTDTFSPDPTPRVTTAETTPPPVSGESDAVSAIPCVDCGAGVPYEPILVMGRDLGRVLARYCDACETKRKIADDQARAEERRNCITAALAKIPPELRLTTLDHPEFNLSLWLAVKAWTTGPDAEWLGLIGPAGCCKTRVLALLAMRGIRAGQRVIWTSAVKLQTEAERSNARDHVLASNAREHLLECQYAPVLIIDDIGKNTWDHRFERHFFTILDHRRNYRLPVLWSANVHPEGFSQVITKANAGPIIGRLMDRTAIFDLFPPH
jgi:chromosomal replication initiation ATPase DnaA